MMKSGKQRREEILAKRRQKSEAELAARTKTKDMAPPLDAAPCNPLLLAPNNSYGPSFVLRGYYLDMPFVCAGCGKEEVWTATQQKWWYEVAKGDVNSSATRCRSCRRKERERKSEARRVHQEGLARKQSKAD